MTLKALVLVVTSFCQLQGTSDIDKEPGRSCVDFMVNCTVVNGNEEIKEDLVEACKVTWKNNKETIIKAFESK